MMQGLSHTVATAQRHCSHVGFETWTRHDSMQAQSLGCRSRHPQPAPCGGHRPGRSPATPAKLCSGPLGQWVLAWASNVIVLPDPLKWTVRLSSTHTLLNLSSCCSHKGGHYASSCPNLSVPNSLLGISKYLVLSRYLDKKLLTQLRTSPPA